MTATSDHAVTGRPWVLAPSAAVVHLLALGTAVGAFVLIGRPGPPDLTEHDRFGLAVAAGLATGAVLTLLTALTVPRPLRLRWLAAVGGGLLPSFTLAIFGPILVVSSLVDVEGAVAGLALGTAVGATAGLLVAVLRGPAVAPVLAVFGVIGALGLFGVWTATALYQ
jgi:hypothetical protein